MTQYDTKFRKKNNKQYLICCRPKCVEQKFTQVAYLKKTKQNIYKWKKKVAKVAWFNLIKCMLWNMYLYAIWT